MISQAAVGHVPVYVYMFNLAAAFGVLQLDREKPKVDRPLVEFYSSSYPTVKRTDSTERDGAMIDAFSSG